ncbi:MAG: hypothetical protein JNJ55_03135 [Betaproteobacteria bacterium]|nr:hypothetical protein [Betaproteobacteria bacterium]
MNRRHFLRLGPLFLATPTLAHHGWSSFDEAKPVYLEGKVKSLKWQNPHAEINIVLAADVKLPADLPKRAVPAQKASVDGTRILGNAALPKRRGEWTLELSPMTRIAAWKVPEPKVGDTVAAVGYTFLDEKGPQLMRVEYLILGTALFGLRSMPA